MSEEITKELNRIAPRRWKRYPRYKDSGIEWIGEIPEEWKIARLKHLTKKIGSGITPRGGAESYLVSGIPLIRSQNVQFEGLSREGLAYISNEQNEKMINSKVLPNDVLLNITGASIGRTCMVPQNMEQSNVNQHVCIIRPKKSSLSQFIWRFLSSHVGQIQVFEGEDGISREGLNFERIKNFVITLPPDEDIERIAAYLDRDSTAIMSLVSKKQRLIELLKEKRAAIITRAVTKGLDPDTPMKDSGVEWVGKIPQEWGLIRFKHMARMKYGSSLPSELRNDGDFLVYGSNGPVGMNSCANTFAPVVVLGRKVSFGKVNYSDKPVFAIDTTYYIDKSCTDSHMKWLFYLLQVLDLDSVSMDTGVPGLSREHVHELIIPKCSYDEQRKISVFLDNVTSKIDSFISKIEKSIELLKEYRSALITAAVTGKIDVREEVP